MDWGLIDFRPGRVVGRFGVCVGAVSKQRLTLRFYKGLFRGDFGLGLKF